MAFVDTEQRNAGEVQQKVGRLKLSEAIRTGARIRPQCVGRFFREGGSCAMGAAYEAMGGRNFENEPHFAENQVAAQAWMERAIGHSIEGIWMKNDTGWTRESIADWLATQGL